MKKETMSRERYDTRPSRARPHFPVSTRGNGRSLPHGFSRCGTHRIRTNLFSMLLRWQSLKTTGGYILVAFSLFAAGPCQLWKAENRAKLGALLGFPGSTPMVSPLTHSPHPLATHVPSPAFTPGLQRQQSPGLLYSMRRAPPSGPAAFLGAKPIIMCIPQLAGLLLDYAFNNTPVAVVQVIRFPWEVVLTDSRKFHVHRVADPEAQPSSASVHVLAVKAQGPYVAVWIPDPGVPLKAEEPLRSYRFQLVILPGAVTRAEDGRSVIGSTHAFAVSEQSVAEDLAFLDMMTPAHIRVSGDQANRPSAPEATRASLLDSSLDPDAPPTPLSRILARIQGSPAMPPGWP